MKFYAVVARDLGTNQLDFSGNLDVDSDRGLFEGILPLKY